jgi:hypothetical protein
VVFAIRLSVSSERESIIARAVSASSPAESCEKTASPSFASFGTSAANSVPNPLLSNLPTRMTSFGVYFSISSFACCV